MNFQDHKSALLEIKNICLILSDEIYAKPLNILTGRSIGQHIRHIIEFYHCLLSQANKSVVNYDLRKRDGKRMGFSHGKQQGEEMLALLEMLERAIKNEHK